jgi:hypothetical protein
MIEELTLTNGIQALSASVIAVLTVAVVRATTRYADLTDRIARSTEASGFLQSTPLVVAVDFSYDHQSSIFTFRCRNIGHAPALNIRFQLKFGVQTYERPWGHVPRPPGRPQPWEVLSGSDRVMAPNEEVMIGVEVFDWQALREDRESEREIVASYSDIARREFEVLSRPGWDYGMRYRLGLGEEWIQLRGKDWGELAPPAVEGRTRWRDFLRRRADIPSRQFRRTRGVLKEWWEKWRTN